MLSALVWLAFLAFLPEVESPPLHALCDAGEYFYAGICCKYCPAGTHVEENCYFPHTLGICKSCTDGENYTQYDNGLDNCLPCDQCKSGYKMISPCTRKKNTECQCNDGYFCPPGCEECVKCKTWCPVGQVIVQSCSATTDMKCGLSYTESSAYLVLFVLIVLVGLILLMLPLGWLVCKLCKSPSETKKEKEEVKVCLIAGNNENVNSNVEASTVSQDKLPETAERSNLGSGSREDSSLRNMSSISPSLEAAISNEQSNVKRIEERSNKPTVRIKNPSSRKLEDTYFQIKDQVGSSYWNPLMRKCGLLDNDIDKIILDYFHQTDEQYYQMLKTLRDRVGVDVALYKIIAGLEEMDLKGIYENLINDLKSKDLVTMEAGD
ncbi:tumor necrosis factor receptor superfamily member 10A-like [Candoia aspera]|uniref:tumor necrosis factor receptor superfamily member 10A-like n=1 Tax=Candoia aspera TaxID=51853 RepID=UPI002FD80420